MPGRPPKPREPGDRSKIAAALSDTLERYAEASRVERIESRTGRRLFKRERPAVEVDEVPEHEIDKDA